MITQERLSLSFSLFSSLFQQLVYLFCQIIALNRFPLGVNDISAMRYVNFTFTKGFDGSYYQWKLSGQAVLADEAE